MYEIEETSPDETEEAMDREADLRSVYQEEVNRGVDLDESRATEDQSAEVTANQPFATEQHHVFPQQYREEFAEQGIDVDRYTIDVDRDNHQGVIHAADEFGNRNPDWTDYYAQARENPDSATRESMIEHAQQMMDDQGLSHQDMHAYREPDEATSLAELNNPAPEATETAEPPEAPSLDSTPASATGASTTGVEASGVDAGADSGSESGSGSGSADGAGT
ncbi:MAG: DUF2380 domain-containing protein [Limisphaerales bacterium]